MVECKALFLTLTKKMCNKSVGTYLLQYNLFRMLCFKKCDKTVDTCPFVFDSVPDQCMTQ